MFDNKLCLILGGNRRSYTAAQVLEMITGIDSDVALTDDEHENDDADSDSDFETINMNDLRQDHDHQILQILQILLIGILMEMYHYLKCRQPKEEKHGHEMVHSIHK